MVFASRRIDVFNLTFKLDVTCFTCAIFSIKFKQEPKTLKKSTRFSSLDKNVMKWTSVESMKKNLFSCLCVVIFIYLFLFII